MENAKKITLQQVGKYCTSHLCHKCPIKKWNDESGLHNDCMESLRFPEVADLMLKEIRGTHVADMGKEEE